MPTPAGPPSTRSHARPAASTGPRTPGLRAPRAVTTTTVTPWPASTSTTRRIPAPPRSPPPVSASCAATTSACWASTSCVTVRAVTATSRTATSPAAPTATTATSRHAAVIRTASEVVDLRHLVTAAGFRCCADGAAGPGGELDSGGACLRRSRAVAGAGVNSGAGWGRPAGVLIALPRCARSALHHSAVTLIRSRARSPHSLAALGQRFARRCDTGSLATLSHRTPSLRSVNASRGAVTLVRSLRSPTALPRCARSTLREAL